MSQYTTGKLAKTCDVTVRTVQFYDQRGILVPSALTEGGRWLYSDEDLKRMKIICFLWDTGLSLDTIGQLLKEAFFARHTMKTRKLTCAKCGHHGFCVETWGGDRA